MESPDRQALKAGRFSNQPNESTWTMRPTDAFSHTGDPMTDNPLQSTHEQLGARFDDHGAVLAYGDPAAETRAVRDAGGYIHLSDWGVLSFEGKDTLRFVHGQVTNEIQKLEDGHGNHCCVLTNKGKIIGDLFLYRTGRDLMGFCGPGQVETLIETMAKYKVADRVKLQNVTADWGLIGLSGATTEPLIRKVFVGTSTLGEGTSLTKGRIGDAEAIIFRAPSCPHATEILAVPREHLESAWNAVAEAAGPLGMKPYGREAADLLRIEDGLPWFGVDFTGDNFPGEAALDHTVSYNKGCYIGQETIARVHYLGHFNKYLVGLLPDGEVEAGQELRAEDKKIGQLTSVAHSPTLDRPIALGYVKRGYEEAGATVDIVSEAGTVAARVVETPFLREA